MKDKAFMIEFLKDEDPELYNELLESGELSELSPEELVHRYASRDLEMMIDFSEVTEEDLPPADPMVISKVMKTIDEMGLCEKKNQVRKFISIPRVLAIAAGLLIVFGLTIITTLQSKGPVIFRFEDSTSLETTDYAIRVRAEEEGPEGIFQDELCDAIKKLLVAELEERSGYSLVCKLSPVKQRGNEVLLTLSEETAQCEVFLSIKLTTRRQVFDQLRKELPGKLDELYR